MRYWASDFQLSFALLGVTSRLGEPRVWLVGRPNLETATAACSGLKRVLARQPVPRRSMPR